MIPAQTNRIFDRIRGVAMQYQSSAGDGELVNRYVRSRDEAAFEAILRRHCRMVLGVCRRILGNSHDADDAFQATFLVLVRKAATIKPAAMVGNWLYGVAHRTALEARRAAAKRRTKEAHVPPRMDTENNEPSELHSLLDRELARMPDKLRAVIILCDLEGRTRKEAAQQLGLPDGTIASRLSRARVLLAKRLSHRKAAITSGALLAAMAEDAASATTPFALIGSTLKAARAYGAGKAAASAIVSDSVAALTEGVIKTMFIKKLKTVVALAVICIFGAGLGSLSLGAAGHQFEPANTQPIMPFVANYGRAQNGSPQAAENGDAGNQTAPEKSLRDDDQRKQILDLIRQGFEAQRAKGDAQPKAETLELYQKAFLKGFEVASELAKAVGKKTPEEKVPSDQISREKNLFAEAFLKAFQASRDLAKSTDNKTGGEKVSPKAYAEAFLMAFQLANEIARMQETRPPKATTAEQKRLDRAESLRRLEEIERLIRDLKKRLQDEK